MISFFQFLEEAIKFKNAKNQNYTATETGIIFLVEDDMSDYPQIGDDRKTHGIASHAIKHYAEYDAKGFNSINKQVRNTIRKYALDNPDAFIAYKSRDDGTVIEDREFIFTSVPQKCFMNTLDLINDKRILGKPLLDIEFKLLRLLNTLSKKYESIIESTCKSATSVEKMHDIDDIVDTIEKSPAIQFNGLQSRRGATNSAFVLDLERNGIVIISNVPNKKGKADKKEDAKGGGDIVVRTMYTFDLPKGGKKTSVSNFMVKLGNRMTFDNEIVKQALIQYAKQ